MIGLLQRVTSAEVTVEGSAVAAIDSGVLVFVGVERDDNVTNADRLLERLLGYRVFPDHDGKMNQSVADRHAGVLLVPQFTLAADTKKGMRPSFTPAAEPEKGRALFDYLVARAQAVHADVAAGVFGAHMRVTLTNDGPVTFWLAG